MITEATIQQTLGDRVSDTPLHKIDITSFLEKIKKDKSWKENDPKGVTVFKSDNMRIILYGIRKGTEVIKQKKDGKITIQVLEGRMQFNSGDQSVKLRKGQMLIVNESAAYSIVAKRKTFFLKTFTKAAVESIT